MFVYADNAATTKIKKSALDAMMPWLADGYGNASGFYSIARDAKRAVEEARKTVAEALEVKPEEIYFTSGGTEADNWALKCAVPEGGTLITTAVEHHAVLHTAQYLAQNGRKAVYLPVDEKGHVIESELDKALEDKPSLISIMYANNEIGTLMRVSELFARVKAKWPKALTHTDAVQAIGHIPVSLENVDMLALSAHKFGGPKGVGALYVRRGVSLLPLLHGGGHERGKRSSTENVAGIVGLAAALRESAGNLDTAAGKIKRLRERLIDGVLKIPYSFLNGDREERLPGNASFIFEAVEGESLVLGLDGCGICASSGSACSSGTLDPSHVLLAIGLPQEVAHGSLRLSLSEENAEEEIDYIVEQIALIVARRRAMSPLWDEKEQRPTERFWRK